MLEFHPLANLFPLIEGAEFEALVADVKANGIRENIRIHEEKILDGRNRYRAGIEAGLIDAGAGWHNGTCAIQGFAKFLPDYQGDALAWVLSKNLHRRHLTTSQRAMIAAEIANLGVGRPAHYSRGGDNPANLPDLSPVKQEDAAERLNVSERSVRTAAQVRETGAPELVDAVKRGDVAVSAAAEIAALPVTEQLEILRSADPKAFSRVAKERRAERQVEKREKREQREADLGARQVALPDKRYGVILADPEWRFEPWSDATGMDRAADNHYPTSLTEVIAARPVASIAADDCVLLLWATVPMLPDALEVMRAWGFAYRSHFIWAKPDAGTGYWNRNQHELLLVGVRGNVPAPAPGTQFRSVLMADAGAHSEKPVFVHEIAERHFPSLPKIELNARKARPGWDAWGLEAPDQAAVDADNEEQERIELDAAPVKHTRKTAAPILHARYDGTNAVALAQELGVPVNTIRSWAFREGLSDKARDSARARQMVAGFNAGRGGR